MASIVSGRCVDCRYTECVAVCPVDCFFEVENPKMLVIDPDTCIDCEQCVPACPINAIWEASELPAEYADWADKNRELFPTGKLIKATHDALPTAKTLEQVQQEERDKGWSIPEPKAAGKG